jgi:type IV pilus assembly protein PilP
MTRPNAIAGVVSAALMLLSMGADPAASRAAQTKAAPAVQTGPAVPADYRYSRAGKTDPFRPFLEMDLALQKKREEAAGKKRVAPGRPLSPLQQAELGQFRLLGIAGDATRRTAMVTDGSAKRFYPLFVGSSIGLNDGRVVAILPERVVVEERVESQDKKEKRIHVRQVSMLLHKEP